MEKINSNTVSNPSLFPLLDSISPRVFFLLVFVFQLLLIFQGFDLSDEGFLSIFYQRIFSHPVSVSYNFMFWLTGIIGGTWLKIVSPLGLWGIRLGGAAVNTLTVILTYNLLKKYLNPTNLKLGLLLVIFSLNNDIKVLNYNILSSLFYVVIVYFLFTGLLKDHAGRIFLAGSFVGLNLFIRTPNVLEMGLVTAIIYYHWMTSWKLGKVVGQTAVFATGFVATVGFVLLTMYLVGHLGIFLDSMKLLSSMGKVKSGNPAEQSGYGLFRLLYIFKANNVQSIKYAAIFLAGMIAALSLSSFFEARSGTAKYVTKTLVYLLVVFVLLLIVRHKIDHFTVLFFITGLLLLVAVPLMLSPENTEIKLLFFFGCFFLLSFPLGSSDGLYTAGRYCLWIALPVALDFLLNLRFLENVLVVSRQRQEYSRKIWISEKQLTLGKKLLLGMAIFAGFYHAYYYPFFDRHNRTGMHYSLQSPNLGGIYTTHDRAAVYNELLAESAKYAKPGDYVLAYDRIAMYYFSTNTIPFLTNSLPSVYNAELFKADLDAAIRRNNTLPVIVMQKIATTGAGSKWPEEILAEDYAKEALSSDRNKILDDFLAAYHYREAWSNVAFKILIPDKSITVLKQISGN